MGGNHTASSRKHSGIQGSLKQHFAPEAHPGYCWREFTRGWWGGRQLHPGHVPADGITGLHHSDSRLIVCSCSVRLRCPGLWPHPGTHSRQQQGSASSRHTKFSLLVSFKPPSSSESFNFPSSYFMISYLVKKGKITTDHKQHFLKHRI